MDKTFFETGQARIEAQKKIKAARKISELKACEAKDKLYTMSGTIIALATLAIVIALVHVFNRMNIAGTMIFDLENAAYGALIVLSIIAIAAVTVSVLNARKKEKDNSNHHKI